MRYLVSAMLVVVGIIHLLPLSGVLGSEQLTRLYGLSFAEANIAILMRHRAVLFGILGLFFLFAAFQPQFQSAAFIAGFVSVVSFLWLTQSVGGYNSEISRVFTADIVALVALIIGAGSHAYVQSRG